MSEVDVSKQMADALRRGVFDALSTTQNPVIEVGRGNLLSEAPWYQPVLDHPFAVLIVATLALMGAAHVVTVRVCRRASVPSEFPLSMLWGSFLVAAALGSLRAFPPMGIALATGAVVFLMMRIWRA